MGARRRNPSRSVPVALPSPVFDSSPVVGPITPEHAQAGDIFNPERTTHQGQFG